MSSQTKVLGVFHFPSYASRTIWRPQISSKRSPELRFSTYIQPFVVSNWDGSRLFQGLILVFVVTTKLLVSTPHQADAGHTYCDSQPIKYCPCSIFQQGVMWCQFLPNNVKEGLSTRFMVLPKKMEHLFMMNYFISLFFVFSVFLGLPPQKKHGLNSSNSNSGAIGGTFLSSKAEAQRPGSL